MATMMIKFFKIFMLLLFIAALAGLGFYMVAIRHQPWWAAATVGAGVIGILVGIFFIRKYLVRSREQKFVQRVIDQDTAALERAPVSRRHELIELQEHWKESVKRLSDSHLRKMGNPLYVLPWYLIMGESKTGKTSAVKNTATSTPMTEISRASGLSGTRNCDWWFFDQAVILDTAGRYTIPIDEGPDLEEWKQFLVLLGKYRKKEPLNGVIVAISADKLIKADAAALREEGQSIRRRIDQMMRTMGARFPVYLLVTKMDLVHGFNAFNNALPTGAAAQAMGYANTQLHPYWQDVLEAGIDSIAGSLKKLRFLMAHQSGEPDPGAIMFPTEFERMIPGMAFFLEAIFEENPYQETPLLRGLYFSSALRKDNPVSEFLTLSGLTPGAPTDASPGAGIFLKDFFAGILPRDRDVFTPLREYVLWRRMTRNLGLVSWGLICLSVCGLLAMSYYHNYSAINDFRKTFYDPPALCKDYAVDLVMLDKMRLEILDMERKNREWILPRFGLDHSERLVNDLKQNYLWLFRKGLLDPLDEKVMTRIERTAILSDDEFVDYTGYVVAQIRVLRAHQAGRQSELENEFRLIALSLLTDLDKSMIPEIVRKFGDTYFAYLNWENDKSGIGQKIAEFKTALVDLIDKRGADLQWLVQGWIPETAAITPATFLETETAGKGLSVSGAFTQSGREHIETFISYIESALEDKEADGTETFGAIGRQAAGLFATHARDFRGWYRDAFFSAWLHFMTEFPKAVENVGDAAVRRRLALKMTTGQNPYFKLLQRAGDEIKSLGAGDDNPPFARLVLQINEIRDLAMLERREKTSVAAKLSFESKKIKEAVERKTDTAEARKIEAQMALAHAWDEYMQAIAGIKVGLGSLKQGEQLYRGVFSDKTPGTEPKGMGGGSTVPLLDASYTASKLKTMMAGAADAPAVWELVLGPRDFLMDFAAGQAACFIQQQWRKEVLSGLEGLDPDKIPHLMFNKPKGLAWQFLNDRLTPFISRSENGYVPEKDFRGQALPFKPGFMHFLNQGEKLVLNYQPEYGVTFETVPLSVNDGAKDEPFAAILKVNCSDGDFVLENFNYPQKAAFKWRPADCGDTSLRIQFRDFNLNQYYRGSLGFARLLKDFRDGSHTYPADAFPDQAFRLSQLGVSSITLAYKISGGDAILKLLDQAPPNVPETIIQCHAE